MVKTTTHCILVVLFAILLPPVSMYLMKKFKKQFWISLVLTILCFLPGVIYTIYYIIAHPTKLYISL